MKKDNVVQIKSYAFAVRIVKVFNYLSEQRKEYVLSKQLLRCGTSIGANVHEAQNAESKLDFIHKLKIAHKEADETMYWLTICEKSHSYTTSDLKDKLQIIIKILSKIIASTKNNLKTKVN